MIFTPFCKVPTSNSKVLIMRRRSIFSKFYNKKNSTLSYFYTYSKSALRFCFLTHSMNSSFFSFAGSRYQRMIPKWNHKVILRFARIVRRTMSLNCCQTCCHTEHIKIPADLTQQSNLLKVRCTCKFYFKIVILRSFSSKNFGTCSFFKITSGLELERHSYAVCIWDWNLLHFKTYFCRDFQSKILFIL